MLWGVLAGASALLWLLVLLLPWAPWRVRETLAVTSNEPAADLSDLSVLIPARNEAAHIQATLHAVAAQGNGLHVIVVDDQSSDGTAALARQTQIANLNVIAGEPLPDGWSGKLWALQQGLPHVTASRVLLLDADIELEPGLLATLLEKMQQHELHFVSLMVELRMQGFWERLLLPAFVYFFKLVYPFRLSNDARWSRFAAAAGGCILVDTQVLRDINAFGSLRDALIDDCTLAQRVKAKGYRTWIGLTRAAQSLRRYDTLTDIWNMVARTAFTQLHYSSALLALVSLLMVLVFWVPVLALLSDAPLAQLLGVTGLGLMAVSYLPTLRYYHRSALWVLLLPLIGSLFLAMTWSSAWRYFRGQRSAWKDRIYDRRRKDAESPGATLEKS
jgi:hopene-associated glycosyltransferase HpnB